LGAARGVQLPNLVFSAKVQRSATLPLSFTWAYDVGN